MPEAPKFDKAQLLWSLPWDADWVTAVVFLGPTRRVAAGNNLGQIVLWDLPEKPEKPGESAPVPMRKLVGHTNTVTRLCCTKDGRWLISASLDHTIRYWDMQASADEAAVETIALNDRTREDLIRRKASKVPAVIEVKVPTQQAAKVLTAHKEWINGMCLSQDETQLLTGDDAGQVILWDRAEAKEIRRWQTKGWVYAVALSPDNKQALVSERKPLIFDSGPYDGIKLWDTTTGQPHKDLTPDFKGMHIAAALYSADGKTLLIGRGGEAEGKLFLADPLTGKKTKDLTPIHQSGVTDVILHPDGKHAASTGRDTQIRIWDLTAEGKLVAEISKPRGGQFKDWFHALSFTQDGLTLAAADMAGAVQIWSLAEPASTT